jgi:octanoyl-[GcvH]:protein N-octanoyltransferase
MRVLRGRAPTLQDDRAATREFLERTVKSDERGVRVWIPYRHVAFGRRDANREEYDAARRLAAAQDFPTTGRSVGGHAVAFTGHTVAFAYAEPVAEERSGIQDRYDRIGSRLQAALTDLAVDASEGEPDGAFCPGTHSLSAEGKIAGLAQRVRSEYAVVSGVVVVRDHEEIASVLEPVYGMLDVPFERDAVGSIDRAGGDATPHVVVETIEDHLADSDGRSVEQVRET